MPKKRPTLFIEESVWLFDLAKARCEFLAIDKGVSVEHAAKELGRAMVMQGVALIGQVLKLPHDVALPIGRAALKEFDRIIESRN